MGYAFYLLKKTEMDFSNLLTDSFILPSVAQEHGDTVKPPDDDILGEMKCAVARSHVSCFPCHRSRVEMKWLNASRCSGSTKKDWGSDIFGGADHTDRLHLPVG